MELNDKVVVAARSERRKTWPTLYGTSKAALDRLTAGIATELKGSPAVILIVNPGFTWTERLDALGKDVGLDISDAQPNDYPGRVIARVLEGGAGAMCGPCGRRPSDIRALGARGLTRCGLRQGMLSWAGPAGRSTPAAGALPALHRGNRP